MKIRILETIKIVFLALVLSVGVGYVFASWASAPANPPNNNTDAPINVGSSSQIKTGSLTLTGLLSLLGGLVFNPNGSSNPIVGQVLTAQDTAGTVAWGTIPGSKTICNQNDGYIYSIPDTNIDDWGATAHDDSLQLYCRNHIVRYCLSNEPNCPWRTSITSDDADTCSYSTLTTGVGTKKFAEWPASPAPLWDNGTPSLTSSTHFNTAGIGALAYVSGTNTWYLCKTVGSNKLIYIYP
jgi:hypothetical protein